MEFQSGPEGRTFDAGSAGALAFAARATLARLPQFTPIGVSQFSPLAARAIPTPQS
jgi:hypothetical protein